MSIPDLKSHIISRLSLIEDESILQEIYNLIEIESGSKTVYTLSPEEKNAVEEGLKDIQNGKAYSTEKANALMKEWQKK